MTRPVDIAQMTVPALAYLGDSVLELRVRSYLVTEKGLSTAAHLNSAAMNYVTAPAQARAMERVLPLLDGEELAVYKRGRNGKGGNVPKSATSGEYRSATGMEVLFGWLYLRGADARIDELFCAGFAETAPDIPQSRMTDGDEPSTNQ